MPKDKEKDKSKDAKDSKDKKKSSDKSVDKKEKDSKKDSKSDKSVDTKKSKKEGDKKAVKIDEAPSKAEIQIQEPPAIQQRQLVEIPVVQPEERLCIRHKLPLKYFCETSEEPVCEQCTIQGPHNNQLHRICNLHDAFNRRAGKLTYSIENNLREKSLLLGAQLHRVEYRIEEIKYITTIIERDIRVEYGGILERLNNAEGVKLSILNHDVENLQKELSKINEIGHTFFDLIKDPTNPVPFLLQSRSLWENANYQISKPFKNEINIYPYDMPRELQEVRQKLSQVEANNALIGSKDEIIWKLIQEKQNIETFKGASQLEDETNQEVQEWAKLAEDLQQQLQKYQLVCFFCGAPVDEKIVNKSCTENKKLYSPQIIGFTSKQPKVKFYGNKRHFFAKPLDIEILNKIKHHKAVQIPIQEIQKAQGISLQKNINIEDLLKDVTDEEGYISNVKFCAVLIRNLNMQIEDLEKVINWLDPQNIGKICGKYFLKALKEIPLEEQSQ
ncbi:hypothetical protein ABPG74_010848 [Tetrahymena malaccensis]